ncbi:hypothetical protein M422DRAFT_273544, partial [Sphaerobolus stellatus SS14]
MKLSVKFSLVAAFIGASLVAVQAAPSPGRKRDAFVPPILQPNSSTIWDISVAPAQTSNGTAIQLRNRYIYVYAPRILAENFDLYEGYQPVLVPDDGSITTRNDWQIVLFGDSSNVSDDFSIAIGNDALPPSSTLTPDSDVTIGISGPISTASLSDITIGTPPYDLPEPADIIIGGAEPTGDITIGAPPFPLPEPSDITIGFPPFPPPEPTVDITIGTPPFPLPDITIGTPPFYPPSEATLVDITIGTPPFYPPEPTVDITIGTPP